MTPLTLAEAVEKVPALYDALRDRDSHANHVCELLARNAECRTELAKWKSLTKKVKSLYGQAMEMKP